MLAPAFPFLADDIYWAELPILCWVFVAIMFLLVAVARFGWGEANIVLSRYRLWWGLSLTAAIIAAIVLGAVSGQPLPHYL